MKKSLTKRERLKSNIDFNNVFTKAGKSRKATINGISLRFRETEKSYNRIGIVVTKRFGNAVKRNKAKRHIREIYRNMKEKVKTGYDIVIILYPGEYKYETRREQVYSLFEKANLFRSLAL